VLVVLAVAWSAFAIGMAAAKTVLADRLGSGRSQRARKSAIGVELAMTGFGVLSISTPYSGPVADLAGFVGACLSFAAAVALTRRRARQYAESGADTQVTSRDMSSGPMSFRQHPASRSVRPLVSVASIRTGPCPWRILFPDFGITLKAFGWQLVQTADGSDLSPA